VPREGPLPEGFLYRPDFITPDEERALIAWAETLPFEAVVMRGYVGKRRTVQYGVVYGFDNRQGQPGPGIPEQLLPLRERAGTLAGVAAEAFTETLVTEYSAGTAIGWHRDAPMFGVVVGVSLGSACRMRFRRGHERGSTQIERASIVLEPRSAYVIDGPARSDWQHSIPAVDGLRYSITFRTQRALKRRGVLTPSTASS
jgi:alkylated DNA repair dioxygenase AlkB